MTFLWWKDSDTGTGWIIDLNSRSGETFSHLNPNEDRIRLYDKNVTFKRIDKENDHPSGVYTFGEQDGTVANGHALYPDEIKDWENYRCMKGISMPNYTINKGTLAENMATAAIEYSFVLVENMAGRAEELHRGRLLKSIGDNYGNGGWWRRKWSC